MSPVHDYLYHKSDIILSKTNGFAVISANVSLSTKRSESDIISYCDTFGHVHPSQHISLKITSERCLHFIGLVYY